jgi:hypothetical protein
MPTVLYKWDFETGDTQGWVLGPYSSLNAESKVQGVYSILYYRAASSASDLVMYITDIDLSTASKPLMLFIVRDTSGAAEYPRIGYTNITVTVKDSAGNTLLTYNIRLFYTTYYLGFYKVVAVDLSPVAGRSGLRIEISENFSYSGTVGTTTFFDNIHIIDGGDKEYNIALLANSGIDRTVSFSIPDADKALPSGSARFSISLGSPPHPLDESRDVFSYTAVTDQGSASITSTDASNRHASPYQQPSTIPGVFTRLDVRAYVVSVASGYYAFDEVVVVSFWDTSWNLKVVYVFRVAITLNAYSPLFATAMINTTYGTAWNGQRDFSLKVHGRSLTIACYVKYLVGDNTLVRSGTVKVEVYSSDYSTKYGESVVDLTVGTELTGPDITGIPVDTDLKLRISWSIVANARVVLTVRPIFKVY